MLFIDYVGLSDAKIDALLYVHADQYLSLDAVLILLHIPLVYLPHFFIDGVCNTMFFCCNFFKEKGWEKIQATLQKTIKKIVCPCCQKLEDGLNQLRIYKQPYHGGCFVGNHIHKLLHFYRWAH